MTDKTSDKFLRGGAYIFLGTLLATAVASLLLGVYALADLVL